MSAFVWCDICGKAIEEGDTAFVRQRTSEDPEWSEIWGPSDEDCEATGLDENEVWQCKGCKDSHEGNELD